MKDLNAIEIKAFVPSKDFERSKSFYQDLGFTKASDSHGVAYFYSGNCSFLLQDFYSKELADNFMMHLLVEDAEACYQSVTDSGVIEKYKTPDNSVRITELTEQPWGMLDFVIIDPSGVLWRIGQNI